MSQHAKFCAIICNSKPAMGDKLINCAAAHLQNFINLSQTAGKTLKFMQK